MSWVRTQNAIFQHIFFAWLAAWLIVLLVAPVTAQRSPQEAAWLLVWLLGSFLPPELYGAVSKRLNDTLSETVWRFTRGNPARAWFGRLLGCALAMQFTSVPFLMNGHAVEFFTYGPVSLVGAGIASWLTQHLDDSAGARG